MSEYSTITFGQPEWEYDTDYPDGRRPTMITSGGTWATATSTMSTVLMGNDKPAGYWVMGNIKFSVPNKPRWLTRIMVKLLLQWEYENA